MTRGLLAPLSPADEIALRRVAHGSPIIDAQVAANLCRLALIERTPSGLRLTPLGRQRYDAMPKALLLAHRHSLHAVAGYVEGLLEKAQLRARVLQPERRLTVPAAAAVAAKETEVVGGDNAGVDDEPGDDGPPGSPSLDWSELRRWKEQAEAGVEKVRRSLLLQRARDAKLCEASLKRIEASRVLLKETMTPRTWLAEMLKPWS